MAGWFGWFRRRKPRIEDIREAVRARQAAEETARRRTEVLRAELELALKNMRVRPEQ